MRLEADSLIYRIMLRLSGIFLVAVLWEVLPRLGIVSQTFLPPLSVVLREVVHLALTQHLLGHALATLWRVMVGIVLAALLAVPLGALLGYWLPGAAAALNPLFRILGQINPFSLMTVFLLFFGVGEKAKLVVVTWVAVWPLIHHTITGIQAVEPDLLKAARSMGISKSQLFWRVLFPGAAPAVLLGIRSAAVLLLAILVAGEMLGGLAGLGWLLHWASNYYVYPYATAPVFAVGLCISLVGVGLSVALRQIEKGLFFWKPSDSIWDGKAQDQGKVRVPGRSFPVVAAAVMLGILLLGGVEINRLNHLNNSFPGENDIPALTDHSQHRPQENGESTPGKDSGNNQEEHSGHKNHSGHSPKTN
ncbi:MAG TPA: ABC transporter permease [Methylomusa anaerophila]|uniref:Putative aliphatic sulfonates transport permease protein SsuC n=1 Tax=Methylomusa anaerophila TaxID=1930071 RepID=A0A348AI69_9FIRM|nr:ABC transporter permease [Methylomusa anaerophila]BBB90767.1 putative aliphatic sulfonates transport permease protein SsuC [Methylomusa anaerophila]HML88630.1 ABC transporter permease [Methylomusa anaerophila]